MLREERGITAFSRAASLGCPGSGTAPCSLSILAAPLTASLISGRFKRTGCRRRIGAMSAVNSTWPSPQ
jgi:hypothetical protein